MGAERRVCVGCGVSMVRQEDKWWHPLTDCPYSYGIQQSPLEEPGEVRVTDATTGGQKGQKLARFDLIPPGPLTQLAEHFGRGARKYENRNWERGYNWSLSFGALQRHAWAFWGGEDLDPETGTPHIIAVAWHALVLAEFMRTHSEKDDRSKGD